MKTPEQALKMLPRRIFRDPETIRLGLSWVTFIQTEALSEGRIAGLRDAAAICSRLGLSADARVALNDEANRLEKDQAKLISSDTPETKTKQER